MLASVHACVGWQRRGRVDCRCVDVVVELACVHLACACGCVSRQIVGGMCWCLTSIGAAVDVDIFYTENPNLGQKMYVCLCACSHRVL